MDRKSPPIALEARQYEALPVLAANSGRLTFDGQPRSYELVRRISTDKTRISSMLDFLMRCRLAGTDPHIPMWITSSLPTIHPELMLASQNLVCGMPVVSRQIDEDSRVR